MLAAWLECGGGVRNIGSSGIGGSIGSIIGHGTNLRCHEEHNVPQEVYVFNERRLENPEELQLLHNHENSCS
jgi:hypothetical protein